MGTIDKGTVLFSKLRRRDGESSSSEQGELLPPCKRRKNISNIYNSVSIVKKRPRKSCLEKTPSKKTEQTRRRVRFAPNVKTFDGLLPSHKLLDHLAWKFFALQPGRGFQSPKEVFHEAWHLGMASELEDVHALMNDLERRLCIAGAMDEVAVLPGGGGRLVQLNPSHLGLVRLLTEMVSAASEMYKNCQGGVITPPFLSEMESYPIVSQDNKFTLFSSSSLSTTTTQVVSRGEVSKRIFSLLPVVDDGDDDDEEEEDEEGYEDEDDDGMEEDDRNDKDVLIVDGIELTKRDVERMEERLAHLQHEYDGGEISNAEYEVAKRHLTSVLDAYRCVKS